MIELEQARLRLEELGLVQAAEALDAKPEEASTWADEHLVRELAALTLSGGKRMHSFSALPVSEKPIRP